MNTPSPHQPESYMFEPESWVQQLDMNLLFGDLTKPLEVDVGCGKGRFLLAHAARNPDTNFIGIDRLLVRLRKINKKLQRGGITNVRLLRIEAAYAIEHLLPACCVDTFYVYFPDPWPKRKHHRRRLVSKLFLDKVDVILRPQGALHVATDHADYFKDMYKLLSTDKRFTEEEAFVPSEDETTDFELLFGGQGAEIGRASFRKR